MGSIWSLKGSKNCKEWKAAPKLVWFIPDTTCWFGFICLLNQALRKRMISRIPFSNVILFLVKEETRNTCKTYVSATASTLLFIFDIFLSYEITAELTKISFTLFLEFSSKILCQQQKTFYINYALEGKGFSQEFRLNYQFKSRLKTVCCCMDLCYLQPWAPTPPWRPRGLKSVWGNLTASSVLSHLATHCSRNWLLSPGTFVPWTWCDDEVKSAHLTRRNPSRIS